MTKKGKAKEIEKMNFGQPHFVCICEKFCENCTVLMVPCFVLYDHYRGKKSNSERVTHPVDAENETKF